MSCHWARRLDGRQRRCKALCAKRDKGQYKIVSEIFIFAVGIVVTAFILLSFQDLGKRTGDYASLDQLTQLSDSVAASILKASESNSTVRLQLGSGSYRVAVENGYLIISMADNPKINVTRFLNMGEYNIKGNTVSEYIIIAANGNTIDIRGTT
jgi:hypothetical protein